MKQRLLYDSYQSRGGMPASSSSGSMKERIRSIALLVLLAAVIVLGIFGGRAMIYRSDARNLFAGTIQTECNSALNLTSSLSRTAGGDSSATLGRIRSHLHAMDVINQFNVGLEGGGHYLVNPQVFTNLYALIDTYNEKIRTGKMSTGDMQTELMAELTKLSALVENLK